MTEKIVQIHLVIVLLLILALSINKFIFALIWVDLLDPFLNVSLVIFFARFKVSIEMLKPDKPDPATTLKGLDYADVPGLSKKEYKLNFYAHKEGTFSAKVGTYGCQLYITYQFMEFSKQMILKSLID